MVKLRLDIQVKVGKQNTQHGWKKMTWVHHRSLTASSPLKKDGWKMIRLPFGMPFFQGRAVKLPGSNAYNCWNTSSIWNFHLEVTNEFWRKHLPINPKQEMRVKTVKSRWTVDGNSSNFGATKICWNIQIILQSVCCLWFQNGVPQANLDHQPIRQTSLSTLEIFRNKNY